MISKEFGNSKVDLDTLKALTVKASNAFEMSQWWFFSQITDCQVSTHKVLCFFFPMMSFMVAYYPLH